MFGNFLSFSGQALVRNGNNRNLLSRYTNPKWAKPDVILDFDQQVFGLKDQAIDIPWSSARLERSVMDQEKTGLIIEPIRQNLLPHSNASLENWAIEGSPTVTEASENPVLGFGGLKVASNGAVWHRVRPSRLVFSPNTVHSVSIWYRTGSSGKFWAGLYDGSTTPVTNLILNGHAGAVSSRFESNGTIFNVRNTDLGNDTHRLTFSFSVLSETSGNWGIGPWSNIVGEDVIVYAAQIEVGESATTFMETNGSSLIHASHDYIIEDSDWANSPEGSLSINLSFETSADCHVLSLNSEQGQEISCERSSSGHCVLNLQNNGSSQTIQSLNQIEPFSPVDCRVAWDTIGVTLQIQQEPPIRLEQELNFTLKQCLLSSQNSDFGPAMIHRLLLIPEKIPDNQLFEL